MASCLKKVLMRAMGRCFEGEWQWGNFSLSRAQLEGFSGWSEGKDLVVWNGNLVLKFLVASCYAFL